MSTLIKWEEPQSVIDHEWQNKYVPQVKTIQRICFTTTLILSVPLLWVTFTWARSELGYTLLGLVTTGCLLPAGLWFKIWPYKLGRRCEIGSEKIHKLYGSVKYWGYDVCPFKWREVQKYEFLAHPHLPQVRCLIFSLKGSKPDAVFNFSLEEVDEQQLQAILRKYLD